jgi:hypothetical protein
MDRTRFRQIVLWPASFPAKCINGSQLYLPKVSLARKRHSHTGSRPASPKRRRHDGPHDGGTRGPDGPHTGGRKAPLARKRKSQVAPGPHRRKTETRWPALTNAQSYSRPALDGARLYLWPAQTYKPQVLRGSLGTVPKARQPTGPLSISPSGPHHSSPIYLVACFFTKRK